MVETAGNARLGLQLPRPAAKIGDFLKSHRHFDG
jgi:hypothetical protein